MMQVSGTLKAPHGGPFRDIDGIVVPLQQMCLNHMVLVCTFKMVYCPVCPEQVRRVFRGELSDFFKSANVRFVVLCPGPLTALRASRQNLQPFFEGHEVTFICDEDLSIAQSVNANIGRHIIPCFFELLPDLGVGWTQIGRGPGNFGETKVARFVEEQMAHSIAAAEKAYTELETCLAQMQKTLETRRLLYCSTHDDRHSQLVAKMGELPPGVLEHCLDWLSDYSRMVASLGCRSWWCSVSTVSEREAFREFQQIRELRDGGIDASKTTQALREGRGHRLQWVTVLKHHEDQHGLGLGFIVGSSEGMYKVQMKMPAKSHGHYFDVPFDDVQILPWSGLSIPEKRLAAQRLQASSCRARRASSTSVLRERSPELECTQVTKAAIIDNQARSRWPAWSVMIVLVAAALAALPCKSAGRAPH